MIESRGVRPRERTAQIASRIGSSAGLETQSSQPSSSIVPTLIDHHLRNRAWQAEHSGIDRRKKLSLKKPISSGDVEIGTRTATGPRQLQQTGSSRGSCIFIQTTGESRVQR